MKKIEKIILIALVFLLLPLQTIQASFSDVLRGNQNFDAIQYVQSKDIVSGYPDGTYAPNRKINRAEFTKIIIESQFSSSEIDDCLFDNTELDWDFVFFSDVPMNAWYAKYVCVAKMNNVIGGYPDGTFGPSNNINFVEASKIIVNAFGYSIGKNDIWYRPFAEELSRRGAVPISIDELDQTVTRGEMAEMIYRLMEKIDDLDSNRYVAGKLEQISHEDFGYPLALDKVEYWGYQIQSLDQESMIDKLVNSNYDMLVVEPTQTDWSSDSKNFDTANMVKRIKQSKAKDGKHRKLVLAYIDIGEAEDWRWYWKWGKNWSQGKDKPAGWPPYIITHDPDGWDGNYPVAYWDNNWKNIIIHGKNLSSGAYGNYNSVLDEVLKSGFDGIYLDWVEGFENKEVIAQAKKDGVDPADEMIKFIGEMREYAQIRNPDFLIIQQNAASLQDGHPKLFDVIDGIAQEAIWYDGDASDKWDDNDGYDSENNDDLINYYTEHLDGYIKADLPVFDCEYALTKADEAYSKSYAKGYIPYITRRSLGNLTTTPPDDYDEN